MPSHFSQTRSMKTIPLKKYRLYFFTACCALGTSLLLTSCDPMKSVLISNHTKKNASVQIVQNSNNQLPLGPENQTEITLSSDGDSSEIRIIYGLGIFSKAELVLFNSMITEIHVETDTDTCSVSGDALRRFLPKKRLGMFNNTIEIKIRNCPE